MFHSTWIIAFAATFIIEAGVLFLWSRVTRKACPIFLLFALNLTTHPMAFLAAEEGFGFALIETFVIAAEALGFRYCGGLTWRDSLVIAILTNGISMIFSFF